MGKHNHVKVRTYQHIKAHVKCLAIKKTKMSSMLSYWKLKKRTKQLHALINLYIYMCVCISVMHILYGLTSKELASCHATSQNHSEVITAGFVFSRFPYNS